jgi:hypothetical protein
MTFTWPEYINVAEDLQLPSAPYNHLRNNREVQWISHGGDQWTRG